MYLFSKLESFKKRDTYCFYRLRKIYYLFITQLNYQNNIKVNTILDLDISKAKDNCIKSVLVKV